MTAPYIYSLNLLELQGISYTANKILNVYLKPGGYFFANNLPFCQPSPMQNNNKEYYLDVCLLYPLPSYSGPPQLWLRFLPQHRQPCWPKSFFIECIGNSALTKYVHFLSIAVI